MTDERPASLSVIASPRRGRGDPFELLRRSAPRNDTRWAPLLFFASLLLALIAGTTLHAQTVRWDPPSGQLGFNQVSELSLIFEECELDGAPQIPEVEGLVFGRPSQSSETSMVNFKVSRRFVLTYPVRPSKRATITIPAFTVQTDKGALRVASASYSVGDAAVGNSGLSVADISSAKINIPKTTFWAGEVFPLAYELSVIRRYFHSPASAIDWQPSPLTVEEWSKPEPSETIVRGERRFVVTQTSRAYVKQPGTFTIKPAQQLVNLNVATSGFGFPFMQQSVEQRVISTDPLELTIKPLPAAPADFTGAVGNFALVSKVVPTSPAVGEPVTWTLELTGVGNWPDISGLPQREVSNDFSVVQPKSKRTMKDNSLFEGTLTEDVVLVPNKPGSYRLGSVKFTYFDTVSGTYKTITTEPVTVTVGPAAAAPVAAQPSGPVQFSLPSVGNNNSAAAPKLPEPVAPVPPENLPRDPITESRRGFAPMSTERLVVLSLLSSALCPLLIWLTLAALRSRAFDPQRRRREARTALAGVLDRMRTVGADSGARDAQLRLWQRHTAALWEIPHAAPGSPLVHAAIATRNKDAAPAWAALWSEADRAQHARNAPLPADWPLRAEGALQAVRVPSWPFFSLFAARNLFPFLLVALVLSVLFVPTTARADAPADYRSGNFTAAEKTWRQAVAATPRDWSLRHNLGLALAQQDRWPEATAHWTAAFLLAPSDASTRADLALGLQRSGMAPPELVEFSRGEGRYALARAAAPGTWQFALLAAALLIAAALVLLLLKGYAKIGHWARPTALVVVILAIALAAAATFSLRTYGQLAHPAVAMVWRASTLRSLPTEADTQKTTALSAGSIAVVDKTFLGWSRLNFATGQSGWARTEDLVALYR